MANEVESNFDFVETKHKGTSKYFQKLISKKNIHILGAFSYKDSKELPFYPEIMPQFDRNSEKSKNLQVDY